MRNSFIIPILLPSSTTTTLSLCPFILGNGLFKGNDITDNIISFARKQDDWTSLLCEIAIIFQNMFVGKHKEL